MSGKAGRYAAGFADVSTSQTSSPSRLPRRATSGATHGVACSTAAQIVRFFGQDQFDIR